MKRLFFSAIALLFLGSTAFAQIETTPQTSAEVGTAPIQKGNWMVGAGVGSLGYSFEGESFNININPRAGYFVSDGIAVGASVNAGLITVEDSDNVWTYGISPFIRYYFPEGSSSTGRFFGQGEVGIAGSSVGDDVTYAFGVGLGYAHFITRTVALEGIAGYNYSKANNSNADAQSGIGINVGFQIYLPGKR